MDCREYERFLSYQRKSDLIFCIAQISNLVVGIAAILSLIIITIYYS